MTQEEQELLYKELSARQFYGVRLEGNSEEGPELLTGIEGLPTDNWVTFYTDMNVINVNFALGTRQQVPRPYLRSLSTMTEEEKKEFCDICTGIAEDKEHFIMEGSIDSNFMLEKLEWCYKHHFNIRLPKHLFIEMPEDWYKK